MSENGSSWTSPKTLIALVALIVSIFGNFYQYRSSKGKLELEQEKWRHEKHQLELENKNLEYELKAFTDKEKNILKYQEELERVNADINVWETGLFKDNLELTMMKNKTSTIKAGPLREAHIKNIGLVEMKIEFKQKELDNSKARKAEIENIINQ